MNWTVSWYRKGAGDGNPDKDRRKGLVEGVRKHIFAATSRKHQVARPFDRCKGDARGTGVITDKRGPPDKEFQEKEETLGNNYTI